MPDRDYYEVLGVARDATPDAIKKAYRGLARKYHPDVNPGDKSAESRFKELQHAYDILSDKEKRARYDQFGSAAFEGMAAAGHRGPGPEWSTQFGGGQGFENIDLSDLLGSFGGGHGAGEAGERQHLRGPDGPGAWGSGTEAASRPVDRSQSSHSVSDRRAGRRDDD